MHLPHLTITPPPSPSRAPACHWCAALLALLVLATGLGAGCASSKAKKKGKEADNGVYMTFHTYLPNPDPSKGTIATEWAPGKAIHVLPTPLLSSFDIDGMQTIPSAGGKGGVGLRCHLAQNGVNSWMQLSGAYRGQPVVLLVGGQFRSFIAIPAFSDKDYFELAGPFSDQEAAAIIAGVKKNYKAKAVE